MQPFFQERFIKRKHFFDIVFSFSIVSSWQVFEPIQYLSSFTESWSPYIGLIYPKISKQKRSEVLDQPRAIASKSNGSST